MSIWSDAVDAWTGNQSIQSTITMPMAVATPLTSAMPEHGALT